MYTYYGTIIDAIVCTIYFTIECANLGPDCVSYNDSYSSTLQCSDVGTYFATFKCPNQGPFMSAY